MIVTFFITLSMLAANALYVAAEFSAVSARITRVREVAENGSRPAKWILGVLGDGVGLDRYVACCQIGITLTSLILGAYGQAAVTPPLARALEETLGINEATALGSAATITLLVFTSLMVVVGELIPKSIALQFPTQAVVYTAFPMRASLWLFRPLIAVLNGSGIAVLRLLRAPTESHRHIHSPQEISLLLAESRDGGLLSEDEQERLDRALRLSVLPVRRIMIPRLDIVGVDGDWTLQEVQQRLLDSTFTRLPVYRGTLDVIEGVVHAKEVARRIVGGEAELRARDIMRPIANVPESMRAESLVTELRRQQSEQAIVIDEHGSVAGLVTLEDLLTEVLAEPRSAISNGEAAEQLPDGWLRLPGRYRVDEAHDLLGVLWEGESDTVGGMVLERLGHIPASGERVTIDGIEVEVESMDGVTVRSLRARPAPVVTTEAEP